MVRQSVCPLFPQGAFLFPAPSRRLRPTAPHLVHDLPLVLPYPCGHVPAAGRVTDDELPLPSRTAVVVDAQLNTGPEGTDDLERGHTSPAPFSGCAVDAPRTQGRGVFQLLAGNAKLALVLAQHIGAYPHVPAHVLAHGILAKAVGPAEHLGGKAQSPAWAAEVPLRR